MEILSLIVGIVSIVLALVAIWHSTRSERLSIEYYDKTKEVLAEIDKKAAVIDNSVSSTQAKLVDTVIAIAKPKDVTADEKMQTVIWELIQQKPELIERYLDRSLQGEEEEDESSDP